jgi:transposase
MALGKRSEGQQEMWVATTNLPKSEGHVFYRKLNRLLAEADFDRTVEKLCEAHYHSQLGRPSIPPGVYFRMLLVGYFEGIGSQRGIAWRCGDSLSLREFLGVPLSEDTPDHSSLTRVRDRLPLEVHAAVFRLVLQLAAEKGLLKGKTVAVDSTNLEANAAMKSIVRRDTGEDWNDYLRRLLKEEQGIENPTDEELRRFDRQRKNKRVSNEEWMSSTDPESRIAKMKDGRTHLAYKAEHVVDLETEVVLAVSIRPADEGDAATIVDSVAEAQAHLSEADMEVEIKEAVADKGYHATDTLELADSLGVRTYIPEPKRRGNGKRNWKDVSEEKRRAVLNNRRRTRGARSKRLQRLRSERVERSFAHICETGGARRSWLCGIEKVQKRYLIAAVARNLGLVMRKLFNMGTARGQQAAGGLVCVVLFARLHIHRLLRRLDDLVSHIGPKNASWGTAAGLDRHDHKTTPISTGC